MKKSTDLGKDKIPILVLKLAVPSMIAQFVNVLYSTVDRMFIGNIKGIGDTALAGVGVCGPIVTLLTSFGTLVGLGGSILMAMRMGAGRKKQAENILAHSFAILVIFSAFLTVLFLFLKGHLLNWFGASPATFPYADSYLTIYTAGTFFALMAVGLNYFITCQGFPGIGMTTVVIGALTNIILDPVFIFGFHMNVAGAAAATVFAQGLSAVILFALLLRKLKRLGRERVSFYDRKRLGKIVKVAVPSIIQQSIVSIGMLLVQSVVNGFGSSVLAGYSAGTRIESICIVPMIAMGNAISTFTAQNIGAGKPKRVRQGYRAGYAIIFAFAALIAVILLCFKSPIISSFVDAEDGRLAYETGTSYLSFIAWFFALIGLKALTDGVLRGAGDVVVFTLANLCNLAVRVFVAFRFAPVWGVEAVWIAVPMGWTANYVISFIRYLSGAWSRKKAI